MTCRAMLWPAFSLGSATAIDQVEVRKENMLVIRMARTGRNKYPTYRIVAAESSRAVTGKFVAILGHYNPHTKELVIKKDQTLKYIGNGAQPSNSVVKLLQREKMELPAWVQLKTKNKSPKKEVAAEPEAAAAPAEALADAEPSEPTAEASEQTEVVAEQAAANSDTIQDDAVKDTDEDSDHTETAATEAAQAEAAVEGETAAADAAVEAAEEPKEA